MHPADSTAKYVPSSMSWVSTPMISNDAATPASSRYAPISLRMERSISALSSGRSPITASRWEKAGAALTPSGPPHGRRGLPPCAPWGTREPAGPCRRHPSTARRGCPPDPPALHAALHPRIEHVAEPVADEIDYENYDEDRRAREEGEPPAGGDVVASLVEHGAPTWGGRGHTQPKEGERGLRDDGACHREGRHHGDGRPHIGQHVAPDEPPVEGAEGAGRFHELALSEGERLPAHDPRIGNPAAQREHEDEVAEAGAEHGKQGHAQQEDGKGELHVARPHEQVVEPAPVEAAEHAQEDAGRARDDHGHEADDEGHPRAVEEAAEDVASEGVRAERMHGAPARTPHGWAEPLQEIVRDRVGGRQERREDGGRRHEAEHEQAAHRHARTPPHESLTRGSTMA